MVGGSFQSIDHIHFHVDRKEVDLELLFEVPSGSDGENAGVCFLTEHVVTPYKTLGKLSDILHLNDRNNQLKRRARPPRNVSLDA